jgi:hypothetical protein
MLKPRQVGVVRLASFSANHLLGCRPDLSGCRTFLRCLRGNKLIENISSDSLRCEKVPDLSCTDRAAGRHGLLLRLGDGSNEKRFKSLHRRSNFAPGMFVINNPPYPFDRPVAYRICDNLPLVCLL